MTVTRITDFTPWDLRNEFTDWETAYLWLDLEPTYSKPHPDRVIAMHAALSEVVRDALLVSMVEDETGKVTFRIPKRFSVTETERIILQRQELIRFAIKTRHYPLFLFQEDSIPRKSTSQALSPGDEKLSGRSKGSATAIIGALLQLNYGCDWLNGDLETRVSELINDLAAKGIPDPVEDTRTLTRWVIAVAKKMQTRNK